MVENIKERLSRLTPEQRARLLARTANVSPETNAIGVRARDVRVPLSSVQERLWILTQIDDENAGQNIAGMLRIQGNFDPARFRHAMVAIQQRHEVLRTAIRIRDGRAEQVILDEPVIDFTVMTAKEALSGTDTTGAEAQDEEEFLLAILRDHANRSFDPASGCMLRTVIVQTASDRFLVMVSMHHMVSDGGSIGIMIREILLAYRGKLATLSALPIQYGDYALWQRSHLDGSSRADRLAFWERQLSGMPQRLDLAFANRPHAGGSSRSARFPLKVSADQVARLQVYARKEGLTLFHIFLSVYAITLMRHVGQYDFAIGVPVSNRTRPELMPVIGCFINLLTVRLDGRSRPSFRRFLAETRDRVLSVLEHAETPFEEVVSRFASDRDLAVPPLFQNTFSFERAPEQQSFALPALRGSFEEFAVGNSIYDLSLELNQGTTEISGWIDYRLAMFNEEEIRRFASCMMHLLDAGLDAPDTPIDRLPSMTEAERDQVLRLFNDTAAEYPREALIHELFEQQVEKAPDAVAVVYEDEQLTYAQLNARSNQLAHHLQAHGVEPGERVAIIARRGVDSVISELATLKTGASYVPIDPEFPTDRQAFMIEDSEAVAVIAKGAAANPMQKGGKDAALWIDLDEDAARIAACPMHELARVQWSDTALDAYVMYTSGSTGTPKGVVVPHAAVNRLVINNGYAEILPEDAIAHCSNPAFDASTFEIWGALLNGARTVIVPHQQLMDPAQFAQVLGQQKVSHLFLTIGLFNQYADTLAEVFARLKYLITGGDVIEPNTVYRVLQQCPPKHFLSAYGPTETTTFATTCRLNGKVDENRRTIPIGEPISNTRIYILDEQGQPVPIGVTGEIHIGGDGVARGYLNRPELNAERFIPDPFNSDTDARMYKTGDLGYWRADGVVEFVGRNDFQVKIRGLRIELGEIEARLGERPEVRETTVIVREDQPGDKRLVAYLTLQKGVLGAGQDGDGAPVALDVEALRAWLKASLPEYMVPSAFVQLDAMPLTSNGKVDRKALPAPDLSALHTQAYEAPKGKTEQQLAAIWQQLLGVKQVGRHDKFFDLGGHSLLAVQFIARVRHDLGRELALVDFFSTPTIACLAETLDTTDGVTEEPICIVDHSVPLPLSWAQHRMWLLEHLENVGSAYHIEGTVRFRGPLNQNALQLTLDAILARHEVLRTVFVQLPGESQPLQQVQPPSPFAMNTVDLSGLAAAERKEALHQALQRASERPFDLASGPLIRGELFVLAQDEHVLYLGMHHIVSDGWSLGVLFSEMAALYEAFAAGHDDPLPPLSVQYADYAQWQRQSLNEQRMEELLSWWQDTLAGAPALLELPTDRPRAAIHGYVGSTLDISLGKTLSQRLIALARQHGLTPFMLLLSAWGLLMSRLSGQGEVVIGTPVANRERSELEGMIGFFVNMLPMRIRVERTQMLPDFLQQVQQCALDAYTHQQAPFDKIIEACRPERNASYSPLFQTVFALQNAPRTRMAIQGMALEMMPLERHTTQYDLLLSLEEGPDGLSGEISYNTDILDRETVERWAGHFKVLLEAMAGQEVACIGELPLLSPEEQAMMRDIAPIRELVSQHGTIHALFEAHAARAPDAIAVTCEDRHLSYGELDRRANRLAHRLRKMGVGPEERVVICADRSLDMMVGILGILKAGGGYVPVDPECPQARFRFILADARARVVLTQHHLKEKLHRQGDPRVPILDVAAAEQDADPTSVQSCEADVTPDNLAYVIYTSGSTGTPKGVEVCHKNVHRLFKCTEPWFRFGPDDVWTMFHSHAFDFSVWEIFGALCTGARLVVVPYLVSRAPEEFLGLLSREQVTVLNQTPSSFSQLMNAPGLRDTQLALRFVIFGGEALNPQMLKPWVDLFGDQRPQLINMYGITETTVHVTYRRILAADLGGDISPLGEPIPDLGLLVLDEGMKPVPLGVAGELYVTGEGLARGYLDRPDLTEARFVANPFDGEQTRLYRSGDLVRWTSARELAYLGRIDQQVKIRGLRIELGEIEARLAEDPDVRECIVVVREDQPGDKRLVAYWTPRADEAEHADDDAGQHATDAHAVADRMRAHLRSHLPAYMVPSAFVRIDTMPLTINGKVDRRALPSPETGVLNTRTYEAPVGEIEHALASVWQALLGVERVGRRDNFFDLGGHSVLVVSLVEQLRTQGLQVDVRRTFHAQTLADLATSVQADTSAAWRPLSTQIPEQGDTISPDMLPLVCLTQQQIESICKVVTGGTRQVQDIYPLAPLQEGVLFHHRYQPERDPYIVWCLLSLESSDTFARFNAALNDVITRHEVLRSIFIWEGIPQPVQVVLRNARLRNQPLVLEPGADLCTQLRAHLKAHPLAMNLSKAPLIDLRPVTHPGQEASEAVMGLLVMHHIIVDHVSLDVILEEITSVMADELPPLGPATYRDFVSHCLAHQDEQAAEDFFRTELSDVTESTAPFGLADVHGDGSAIIEHALRLPPSLAHRIRSEARRRGMSPAIVFHVAYGLLVAKTSGRSDLVIGTVMSGRMGGLAGIDRMLGMFINTLPLRLRLAQASVHDAMQIAHDALVSLMAHEQASLALAQRCSGLRASTPLFSAVLNYRHGRAGAGQQQPAIPGVRVLAAQERSNYPLSVSVDDLGSEFVLTAQMDATAPVMPERLLAWLQHGLEEIVDALEHPESGPLLSLSILPPWERTLLTESFNKTVASASTGRLIHELFEQQVETAPDAIAVRHGEQSLSYAALDARANQLAHRLHQLGTEPDERVVICTERGFELVVAMLGILKAGSAYVPVDPAYPQERIDYLIQDAKARIVLTQSRLRGVLPKLDRRVQVMDLDDEQIWSALPIRRLDCRNIGVTSRSLAYVIYTSGSTGVPKGVLLEHEGACNLAQVQTEAFAVTPTSQILQFASPSFDACSWEVLMALTNGASLHLADREELMPGEPLAKLLSEREITHATLPPTALAALSGVSRHDFPSLSTLVVAGEACPPALARRWCQGRQFVNAYGPTEATVCATMQYVDSACAGLPHLPIGQPIANARVYVLDPWGDPAPVGVAGEIHIGGVGVARGYLNKPELTRERFVRDPYSDQPGARMYRTGDLGRWTTNGTLEYLGRNDDQVKIRGLRIELGEIEARMAEFDGVKEAVVVAREDHRHEQRLVAYWTPADENSPPGEQADAGTQRMHGRAASATPGAVTDSTAVREYLRRSLPAYMVPTSIIRIEAMPLTPNGKIDKQALPMPNEGQVSSQPYEMPRGETEQVLAEIWQTLLEVKRVGRNDSFFDLGGHSLLAARLTALVRQHFDVELPLKTVFESGTLADMADAVFELQIGEYDLSDVQAVAQAVSVD